MTLSGLPFDTCHALSVNDLIFVNHENHSQGGLNALIETRAGRAGCIRRAGRGAGAERRPGQDPRLVGRARFQLGVDLAGEEGPRQAPRQILHVRAGALRRHAADDHGACQQRSRHRQPRLLDAADRDPERQLDDLRVISDEFQDGVEGYYTNEFYVLKDGPIQKPADLKGKVVATNAAGSAIDIGSRAMLKKAGLEDKRDYTVVEAPFPTMRAMLTDKKADLIPAVLPFSLDPALKQDRARCSPAATRSASRSSSCGPRGSPSSTRIARRWWT